MRHTSSALMRLTFIVQVIEFFITQWILKNLNFVYMFSSAMSSAPLVFWLMRCKPLLHCKFNDEIYKMKPTLLSTTASQIDIQTLDKMKDSLPNYKMNFVICPHASQFDIQFFVCQLMHHEFLFTFCTHFCPSLPTLYNNNYNIKRCFILQTPRTWSWWPIYQKWSTWNL